MQRARSPATARREARNKPHLERSPATARREARNEPYLTKPDLIKPDLNGTEMDRNVAETYSQKDGQRMARPNTSERVLVS